MKSLVLMGVLILVCKSLFAHGNGGGNGGDAVVCRDASGRIDSAELLDFYEGRSKRGIVAASQLSLSSRDYLVKMTKKIESWDKQYKKQLENEVVYLYDAIEEYKLTGMSRVKDVVFTTDTLEDINDSMHLTFPRDCKVEQLAVRQVKNFPEDPIYTINSEILSELSERDIVGLVLHEAFYKFFVEKYYAKNSIDTRYLNQRLSQFSSPDEMNFSDYAIAMKNLKYHVLFAFNSSQGGPASFLKMVDETNVLMESEFLGIRFVVNASGEVERSLTDKFGSVMLIFKTNDEISSISVEHMMLNGTNLNYRYRFTYSLWTGFGTNRLSFDVESTKKRKLRIPIEFINSHLDFNKKIIKVINSKKNTNVSINFRLSFEDGIIIFTEL